MSTDNIAAIGIDEQQRFFIRPEEKTFNNISQEANEVYWDEEYKFLYTPKSEDGTYFDSYKIIITAVEFTYGIQLFLTEDTLWANLGETVKEDIYEFNNFVLKQQPAADPFKQQLVTAFDHLMLIIDYPFIFYYRLQKIHGKSDSGQYVAFLFYCLIIFSIISEYIDFAIAGRTVVGFAVYCFFRFTLNTHVRKLAFKYKSYNPTLIFLLKCYSVLLLLMPVYLFLKSQKIILYDP